MGLGKQAKVISEAQFKALEHLVSTSRYATRNKVILLLSYKSGLRSKEIAGLRWSMITDANGELTGEIRLTNAASKGKASGRVIPIHPKLLDALKVLKTETLPIPTDAVVKTQKSGSTNSQFIINLFKSWYRDLEFDGCSSHSGRRTFITNAAKKISSVGGSIRDIQILAGHSSIQTTQRYIDQSSDAQKALVKLL